MPAIEVVRRGESVDRFSIEQGVDLRRVLLERNIPPASVLVIEEGNPVSVFTQTKPETAYTVRILEGYDIQSHRALYGQRPPTGTMCTDRRLSFTEDGDVEQTVKHHDASGLVAAVEGRVSDTIEHYDLVTSGDRLVAALSGEGDSAAMLLALSALQSELDVALEAVTLTEPRGAEPRGSDHATSLAESLDVPHRTVGLETIEQVYDLEMPVREAFTAINDSAYQDRQIAVLETVHRRLFEHVATDADHICLGSHATEFVAGILNSVLMGTEGRLGGIPQHRTGPVSYIYPVALLDKVELSLYHRARTGEFPPTSAQNMWNETPTEQSFLYYIADMLRSYWPGVEYWLIESHRSRSTNNRGVEQCDTCRKYTPRNEKEHCLACRAFAAVDAL